MVLKSLLSWRAIQICSTNEEGTILDYLIVNVLIKFFLISRDMKYGQFYLM